MTDYLLRGNCQFAGERPRVRLTMAISLTLAAVAYGQTPPQDPAAWGADHVDRPLPEFTSGDECLFCHRVDAGKNWSSNRHGQTIRLADSQSPEMLALTRSPSTQEWAGQVELVLGGQHRVRYLKRGQQHGQLDLHSAFWRPPVGSTEGMLFEVGETRWRDDLFGKRCAGCHTTAVSSKTTSFAALSLDCFVCHGEVPVNHTSDGSRVFLSPHRSDAAPLITSVCGQCHLRTGRSQSTGRQYPHQFVVGDNLFRDYRVDLSDDAIARLGPADRHIQQNVRDVVIRGQNEVTCLSCHNVHAQSSRKHHLVADGVLCLNCHDATSKKVRRAYEVHSTTCCY